MLQDLSVLYVQTCCRNLPESAKQEKKYVKWIIQANEIQQLVQNFKTYFLKFYSHHILWSLPDLICDGQIQTVIPYMKRKYMVYIDSEKEAI